MGRSLLVGGIVYHCAECGCRLNIVQGFAICPRCHFDLTGEDDSRPHPWEPWPEVEPEE